MTSPRMEMKLLNTLASGKVRSMVCRGVWLTVLVAACSSPVLAQHGIQEFTANGTFTVPAGVSELRVDAYGGGGGGGGADGSTNFGGGGGGAAYNAGVVTVSPAEVLTIMVGTGGKGGLAGNPAQAGASGGTTKILNSSKVVLFAANGGKGGQGATLNRKRQQRCRRRGGQFRHYSSCRSKRARQLGRVWLRTARLQQ